VAGKKDRLVKGWVSSFVYSQPPSPDENTCGGRKKIHLGEANRNLPSSTGLFSGLGWLVRKGIFCGQTFEAAST